MAPKVPKLNKDPRQKGIQGFLVKTPSASVPIAPPPASLLPTKSSLKRSKPGSNENDETNETSGLEQGKEKMMRINVSSVHWSPICLLNENSTSLLALHFAASRSMLPVRVSWTPSSFRILPLHPKLAHHP